MAELRVATPADAPQLDPLMKAPVAAIFPAYYDAAQTASAVRYVAQVDPVLLVDGTYFVLEAGDEVVACGGWSRRGRVYMGSADAPPATSDSWTHRPRRPTFGRCTCAQTGRVEASAGGSSRRPSVTAREGASGALAIFGRCSIAWATWIVPRIV